MVMNCSVSLANAFATKNNLTMAAVSDFFKIVNTLYLFC